jgi:hypothetical protein
MHTNEVLTWDYDFPNHLTRLVGLQCTCNEYKCRWAARYLMWLVEGV